MTDLIQRITESIFRQEGGGPTALNPGNLRSAAWLAHPTIENGFWQPLTRMQGVSGAAHCVALRIAEGQTLRQLINAWAPPSENNTSAYLTNVQTWAGIASPDVPLWNYIDAVPTSPASPAGS